MAEAFTLYTYFRSSAAYRVRIALNLKGIKPDYRFVHLLKEGGQQHGHDYAKLNPQELVPTLVHEGYAIGQSLAIMEYLDEVKPEPALLPRDPAGRARVRQIGLCRRLRHPSREQSARAELPAQTSRPQRRRSHQLDDALDRSRASARSRRCCRARPRRAISAMAIHRRSPMSVSFRRWRMRGADGPTSTPFPP